MTATTAPEIHELATRAGVTLFDYQQEFLDSVVHSAQPLRSCLFYKTGAGKSQDQVELFLDLRQVGQHVVGHRRSLATPHLGQRGERLGDTRFHDRPDRIDVALPMLGIFQHAGQPHQGLDIDGTVVVSAGELASDLHISPQQWLVQQHVTRRNESHEANIEIDRAPFELLTDQLLDSWIEQSVAFGTSDLDFEKAVVDRANLGRHMQFGGRCHPFAMSGHAQQQVRLLESRRKRF